MLSIWHENILITRTFQLVIKETEGYPPPSEEPEGKQGRIHKDFLEAVITNLGRKIQPGSKTSFLLQHGGSSLLILSVTHFLNPLLKNINYAEECKRKYARRAFFFKESAFFKCPGKTKMNLNFFKNFKS